MLITSKPNQKLTLETYLTYEDGTDVLYELVDGALISMGLGSGQHGVIIKLLERHFDAEIERSQKNWVALSQGTLGLQSPEEGGGTPHGFLMWLLSRRSSGESCSNERQLFDSMNHLQS
ncbi:hypothetical protein C1752_08276 [Acaryochloris thomasi RCC1774]|uniref:Uncharacterized protein n=1 Tax=Acaryochloris thomasi RCC1774 TaxID=1764569 RepID=A0A2W1JA25_9CYAN|nr:Uma2 family endonuclease [Acaryochloris thomasi]PZD71073.1 hypothetical protein C1752_08276 [Acaryochloris thomasi RCC1774]